MTAARLKSLVEASPFEPFTVHVAGGRSFSVPHADFVSMNATGSLLIVYRPDGDDFDMIHVPLITHVTVHSLSADEAAKS